MGGLDSFTAKVLLKTATSGGDEGNNIAADLYKEFKSKQTPSHAIAQSHAILRNLGYKVGELVELMYGMGGIGEIVGFNNNTIGYDGLRYPVYVKRPGGAIYEECIFTTHYEDVPKFKDNPKQLLELYKDDLGLKVVTDIDNPKEVMRSQKELSNKKNIYDLIEFLDVYEHPGGDKIDYVYKYALASLEKQWYKELNLIKKASEFIDSKDFAEIQNTDVKQLLEDKYYSRLSYYNDHHKSFGTPHNEILSIYSWATGSHKEKIKQQLIERCSKMDDNELYAYATLLEGTDIEGDILALLEAKIS